MSHCVAIMVNVLDICAKMRVRSRFVLVFLWRPSGRKYWHGRWTRYQASISQRLNVLSCWGLSIAARP